MTGWHDFDRFMAVTYRVILIVMIVALAAAGTVALVGGENKTLLQSILIQVYLLAIPSALLAYALNALRHKALLPGLTALSLVVIWGAFRVIG